MVGSVPDQPKHFVDRDQIAQLIDGLTRGRVVVTGMRGAGKTQVAAAYARWVLDHGQGVVGWVRADSPDTLYGDLGAIADSLGVADPEGDSMRSARRLRDHLNNSAKPGLLVFDNAENPALIHPLLPSRGGARVVITSTDRAFAYRADVVVDTGRGYNTDQARTYLREATCIDDDPVGEAVLAAELGCLPLALTAAATTINPPDGPGLTYATYLDRLRRQPLPRALRHREGLHEHPKPVDRAIMMSILAAEAPTDDSELDAIVAWLLGLFTVLVPSGIDRRLLTHPNPDLEDLVDDAIERCVRHSLLNWSTDNTALSTHRLTARVLRERARDNDTSDMILNNALDVIEPKLFEKFEAQARKHEGTLIIDQIDALWGNALSAAGTDTRNRVLDLLRWATQQLVETADLSRAFVHAQNALVHHEENLGADSLATLVARNDLADVHESAGRVVEAIRVYEWNLAECERVLGPDHRQTLVTRSDLAGAYQLAGRTSEAIRVFEWNLAECERVLGPDHRNTLVGRINIAAAYESAERATDAISLLEQTLPECERILGPDHRTTLSARHNLAGAYVTAGRLAEAITLFERVITEHRRVLGPEHHITLLSRHALAGAYRSAGRVEEAIRVYESNLTEVERVLGPEHPLTLLARNNLADAYRSAGRVEEAIRVYESNLTEAERVLGPEHPTTLVARHNVADAYRSAGRVSQAIPLLEKALTEYERVLGRDYPDTLIARNNLAGAYMSVGRMIDAIPHYEQKLADRERTFGVEDPRTQLVRDFLAVIQFWLGGRR
ncbi:FxSxx-COOH system tetratricopeptide repeat protein [Nocardia sp. NPDC050710]|uniref:FxSxx-COOH system tetratricopeptide repeat protein n=1 Tax=Nocardia sp. NPDC050710 TaxID=3157220 RepID=UPI0033C67B86